MGTDVDIVAERRRDDGTWEFMEEASLTRSYAMFSVISEIRRDLGLDLPVMVECRGAPDDMACFRGCDPGWSRVATAFACGCSCPDDIFTWFSWDDFSSYKHWNATGVRYTGQRSHIERTMDVAKVCAELIEFVTRTKEAGATRWLVVTSW